MIASSQRSGSLDLEIFGEREHEYYLSICGPYSIMTTKFKKLEKQRITFIHDHEVLITDYNG